ncbi:MAG: hypothetical protein QG608_3023 [Actinomycetota bacterium]|nr:hypothetical protein [Actinomycetota bacterium]
MSKDKPRREARKPKKQQKNPATRTTEQPRSQIQRATSSEKHGRT